MSGRTRHLRDGEWITNRKTDRRQSPKRPLIERLHELNLKHAARSPGWDVRLGFFLPGLLEGFVAPGPHGVGIEVLRASFVQVGGDSATRCFMRTRDFLAVVACQRASFTFTASIIAISHPDQNYGRHMTFLNGALVVSAGLAKPQVYEAQAA